VHEVIKELPDYIVTVQGAHPSAESQHKNKTGTGKMLRILKNCGKT